MMKYCCFMMALLSFLLVSCTESVQPTESEIVTISTGIPPETTSTPVSSFTSFRFTGEISRGQTFEREIAQTLIFRLQPLEKGWEIFVGDSLETDHDFSQIVTPPFHGMNARYIEGWHFRNSDNSGPNEAGEKNVNAPQEHRRFNYVLTEADYQIAVQAYDITHRTPPPLTEGQEQILAQYKNLEPLTGVLMITNLELGNLEIGERAWIENMGFEVELNLPTTMIK